MSCLCPISIPDKILRKFGVPDHQLLVPCGHCAGCARDRRNDWFVRLWSVYQDFRSRNLPVWFFTATIDSNLWPGMTLDSPGVGDRITPFVRSWNERLRYLNGGKMPVRFMCSEFGSKDREYIDHNGVVRVTTGALHFHGLLFGYLPLRKLQDGFRQTHGHVDFDIIRGPEAIRYTVKYCTKDYSVDDYKLRARTFCSPGLGDPSFYFGDSAPTPVVLINGFHYRTPRYFIDKQWLNIYGKERFFSSIGSSVLVDERARDRVDDYWRDKFNAYLESKYDPVLRQHLFYRRVRDSRGPASLDDVLLLCDLGLTGYTHPLIKRYFNSFREDNLRRMISEDESFVSRQSFNFFNSFNFSNLQSYERSQTFVPLSLDFET